MRDISPRMQRARVVQLLILAAGLYQAWMTRNAMNVDGLSYVDIARAYAAGDWHTALNGYWSPLYSWLLAAVFAVTQPAPATEFAVVHAVNFACFAFTLAAFGFFASQLLADLKPAADTNEARDWRPLILAGYAACGYALIVGITLAHVGPDLLLTGIFFVVLGILCRLHSGAGNIFTLSATLGVTLAIGYFTKAVLLPISVVVIFCAALLLWRRRGGRLAPAITVVVLIILISPWVFALSKQKGRLTIGDSGRLNYAWRVDDARLFRHWQGEPGDPVHGVAVHPTRALGTNPTVFEFGSPVGGTYPPWYDPTYWYEGVHGRRSPVPQIRRLLQSAQDFFDQQWFYPALAALVAGGVIAGLPGTRSAMGMTWFVLLPVVAQFGLYAAVLVIPRYLAPLMVPLVTTLLFALSVAAGARDAWRRAAIGAIGTGLSVVFAAMLFYHVWFIDHRQPPGHPHLEVSREIQSLGVPRGARVAIIGEGTETYWAHLAGMKVVAEIVPEEALAFWTKSPGEQEAIIGRLKSAGAVAIVADHVPVWADKAGWIDLGDGVRWLRR